MLRKQQILQWLKLHQQLLDVAASNAQAKKAKTHKQDQESMLCSIISCMKWAKPEMELKDCDTDNDILYQTHT